MLRYSETDWNDANQRYLAAELLKIRSALEDYGAARQGVRSEDRAPCSHAEERAQEECETEQVGDLAVFQATRPPALEVLSATFNLSDFERDVLLLCAGVELESAFAPLCASAQGDQTRPCVNFSLAFGALPGAHWDALSPERPLRYWRLIEISGQHSLTLSPLRIDERVLNYLAGVRHLDERLSGLVEPLRAGCDLLISSHHKLAERIVSVFKQYAGREAELPVVQLCGDDREAKRTIARTATSALGFDLYTLSAPFLPTEAHELETLLRLWERDAALGRCALLVECDEVAGTDALRAASLTRFLNQTRCLLFISARERRPNISRPLITLDVNKPGSSEQRAIWQEVLGQSALNLNGEVETLVSQFRLNASSIQAASTEALLGAQSDLAGSLWSICRSLARPHMDDLAQRIEPAASWRDLVLPEEQREILRHITAHVRGRARVYDAWGFSRKGSRGLGISALFAGASGTGKTLAAEVLAAELRLDLYRIDLSQVVSKYIGETEKNLRRVFEAAEEGGAILLFDEADALFGKRSEVKDSHDRYANIEVSYLLQRMEAYRGLAILTTNLKSALDAAFLRRIRFIVQFPFPNPAQRAEIWRRIFPAEAPLKGLDFNKLAQLNVPGGNIRNIALGAAFLAADEGAPVSMSHLLGAARQEYAKLEKTLTDAETRGWI